MFAKDAKKFLGETYLQKLGERDEELKQSLSYLFKVLSVNTALSIQAHPNKELAIKLHAQFPDKYKDPNHKPEIAVALSEDFKACYGFTSAERIQSNLEANPILAETFPLGAKNKPDEEYLKQCIEQMFLVLDTPENKEKLTGIITGIAAGIQAKADKGEELQEH